MSENEDIGGKNGFAKVSTTVSPTNAVRLGRNPKYKVNQALAVIKADKEYFFRYRNVFKVFVPFIHVWFLTLSETWFRIYCLGP